jgi:hypothetical protein
MANDNNGSNGSNGRKTIELNLNNKIYQKVEEQAEIHQQTPTAYIKQSVQDRLENASIRDVIAEACEEGERLSPESKICKSIAEKKEHHSY